MSDEYQTVLARLRGQTRPLRELSKLTKPLPVVGGCEQRARDSTRFGSFDRACTGHVSRNEGIPHLVYGYDEFSPIRLPHPAIIRRVH